MKITFIAGSKTAGVAKFAGFATAMNAPQFTVPITQESQGKTIVDTSNESCFNSSEIFSQVKTDTNTETTAETTETNENTKPTRKRRTRRSMKTKRGQNMEAPKEKVLGNAINCPGMVSAITKCVAKVTEMTYSEAALGFLEKETSIEPSKETITFGSKSFAEVAGLMLQKQKQNPAVHKDANKMPIPEVEIVAPVVSSKTKSQKTTKATKRKRATKAKTNPKIEEGPQECKAAALRAVSSVSTKKPEETKPEEKTLTQSCDLDAFFFESLMSKNATNTNVDTATDTNTDTKQTAKESDATLNEKTEEGHASKINKTLTQSCDLDTLFFQSLMSPKITTDTNVDIRKTAKNSDAKNYRNEPEFLLQLKESLPLPLVKALEETIQDSDLVSNRSNTKAEATTRTCTLELFYDRPSFSEEITNPDSDSSPEEPPKPVEKVNPLKEIKPLVPSTNRWVPRSRTKKEETKCAPDGSVILESEEIERKVNSALNKLTLEMFEPITDELLTICAQSKWEEDAKTLKQVISLTFFKACDEPYWSSVYAQFFAKLSKNIPPEIKDVNTFNSKGLSIVGGALARKLLLTSCQLEYQKGWTEKIPTNQDGVPKDAEMMSEEYYIVTATKRRGLGLLKFIGNLYNLDILNDQVILHCLRDQCKNTTNPSDGSVESLSQLLKTVGPKFETTARNSAALNLVFKNIQIILQNCELTSRIRFLLTDLEDLRRNQWKSMSPEVCPKTIQEIHKEAISKKSRRPLLKPNTLIAAM